jgi:predicted peroxiredoxin
MEILYIAASGQSDATRASIPWHLAVNGSFEAGQSTGILLVGDAAEVLVRQVRDAIEGLGIAPLRDLLSKARSTSLPVFVWKGCAMARAVTEDDLAAVGGTWVSPPDAARLIAEAERVVSLWAAIELRSVARRYLARVSGERITTTPEPAVGDGTEAPFCSP